MIRPGVEGRLCSCAGFAVSVGVIDQAQALEPAWSWATHTHLYIHTHTPLGIHTQSNNDLHCLINWRKLFWVVRVRDEAWKGFMRCTARSLTYAQNMLLYTEIKRVYVVWENVCVKEKRKKETTVECTWLWYTRYPPNQNVFLYKYLYFKCNLCCILWGSCWKSVTPKTIS